MDWPYSSKQLLMYIFFTFLWCLYSEKEVPILILFFVIKWFFGYSKIFFLITTIIMNFLYWSLYITPQFILRTFEWSLTIMLVIPILLLNFFYGSKVVFALKCSGPTTGRIFHNFTIFKSEIECAMLCSTNTLCSSYLFKDSSKFLEEKSNGNSLDLSLLYVI